LLIKLVQRSDWIRFKVQILHEIVAACDAVSFPRLTKETEWALVEALFDSLYTADIVEEQYFLWWQQDESRKTPDDAVWQLRHFHEWLEVAKVEGEESEEEEEDVQSSSAGSIDGHIHRRRPGGLR